MAIEYVRQMMEYFGFAHDWVGFAKASGIITVVIVMFLVVVGLLANLFVKLQLRILEKIFNYKVAVIITDRVTFMGVVVHELSHAFMLLITGALIEDFSVWDRGGDTLGHVTYRNRGPRILWAFQDTLCACAPTAVGLISLYYLWGVFTNPTIPWWGYVLAGYGVLCSVDHMSMSTLDLKNYFSGLWAPIWLIFLATLYLCKTYV